jgi:hypothetical protein
MRLLYDPACGQTVHDGDIVKVVSLKPICGYLKVTKRRFRMESCGVHSKVTKAGYTFPPEAKL